ncbi:hypothetical protein J4Q44_G00193980 [Coregonus suidteri]|uniref:ZC3H15/TMA46 family C-terminal domain-containing protein n=1 Tax=Coregonus suidteri TaxID=861788 RepID=A0AAN8R223_9TELE
MSDKNTNTDQSSIFAAISPLGPNVTRITLETFLVWKRRKRRERIAKDQQDMERNRADFSAGRSLGVVDAEDFQDIDVARFIPKEVDNARITAASADRFAASPRPAKDTDGERCLACVVTNSAEAAPPPRSGRFRRSSSPASWPLPLHLSSLHLSCLVLSITHPW